VQRLAVLAHPAVWEVAGHAAEDVQPVPLGENVGGATVTVVEKDSERGTGLAQDEGGCDWEEALNFMDEVHREAEDVAVGALLFPAACHFIGLAVVPAVDDGQP
jgi:hypothetical protein